MSILLIEATPYVWHGNPRAEYDPIGNLEFNHGSHNGESDKHANFRAEVQSWYESYKTRCKTMVRLEKALDEAIYITDLAELVAPLLHLRACPLASVTTIESVDDGYRWRYGHSSEHDDGVFWITKEEEANWGRKQTHGNAVDALGEYSAWAGNRGYEFRVYDITLDRPDLAVLVPEGTTTELRKMHGIDTKHIEWESFEMSWCIYTEDALERWLSEVIDDNLVKPVANLFGVEWSSHDQYAILHTPEMPVGGQYPLKFG